jgi:GT2 family glycosyltransferase
MISLVICSRQPRIDRELEENIASTIGAPYEIICVDNSSGQYGICAAYNKGARESRYETLCFLHEDIRFHSTGWGSRAADAVAQPGVGVAGIAGSVVSTHYPAPWWVSNFYNTERYWRSNILQYRGQYQATRREMANPGNEPVSQVAVLDGVWLCCRKTVWEDVRFDEKTLTGFHFYDLDFSRAAGRKGYRNYVLYDVLLEHRSAGTLGKDWLKAADRYYAKWKREPAYRIEDIPASEQRELEYQAIRNYLLLSFIHGAENKRNRIGYWLRSLGLKRLQTDHLRLLKYALSNQ